MNASAIPGRNTVAEVYAQIVKDLTEAIDSKALNVSKSAGDNQGFIDEWAAKALLTRVYIYMGKNQEALDIAKNIIENSPYSLWTKAQYANAWDKNNANHINEMILNLSIAALMTGQTVKVLHIYIMKMDMPMLFAQNHLLIC